MLPIESAYIPSLLLEQEQLIHSLLHLAALDPTNHTPPLISIHPALSSNH